MKRRNGRAAAHKLAGLIAAGAMIITEITGVCFPLTVMAQEGDIPIIEAAEEPDGLILDEAVNTDAVDDIDNVDVAEPSNPDEETGVGFTLEEASEEVAPETNIFGNDPYTKDQYYVTFTVKNNGKQRSWTKELDKGTEKALNEYGFYDSLMSEINAFIQGDDYKAVLVGWSVYTDGFNVPGDYSYYGLYLNPNGYTYDEGYEYNAETGVESPKTTTFKLNGNKDYHFTAQISRTETGTLYVSAIPSVYYNSRAHVAIGSKASIKKEAADLRIKVYLGGEDWVYKTLEAGKDYTISYSNNVNASMKLVREGEAGKSGSYESLYADNDPKRPKVTITGKGEYKGFSAEAYFDIIPMNLGADESQTVYLKEINDYYDKSSSTPYTNVEEWFADITGFGNSYLLKDGKVAGVPKQKVTKSYRVYEIKGNSGKWTKATINLTEGKDYTVEIYKWDSTKNCWNKTTLSDPSAISTEGDYLYLVRGIGNYCGAVYETGVGSANYGTGNVFNTGENGTSAMPYHNVGLKHQFRVTSEDSHDLAKAKVTVKKKALDYTGKAYAASDFGISVKSSSGTDLIQGKDYEVMFMPHYAHMDYTEGVHWGKTVSASNEYSVQITSMGDYFGSKYAAAVKIKGIQFKPAYCTLTSKQKKVPYGSSTTWMLLQGAGIPKFVADGTSPAGTYADDPMYVCGTISTADVYTAPKVNINVAGNSRCGDAVDPSKGVTLTYTHTAIKLQDAISQGLLGFEVAGEGLYNVKGASPETVKVKVKGNDFSTLYTPYSGTTLKVYIDGCGLATLTFTLKKNTKPGDTASFNVKASGVVSGTVKYDYKVKTRTVTSIPNSYYHSMIYYAQDGALISVPVYSQQGKGDINKPLIKIYQKYSDAKGSYLAEVPSNMYKTEKGESIGTAGIATKLKVTNGSGNGFDFGSGVDLSDNYALYKKTLKPADIAKVKVGVFVYDVKNGVITDPEFGTNCATFTGDQIMPDIRRITLSDGTELNAPSDFRLEFGANKKVGKGAGSVTFVFNYNTGNDTFEYGGRATIKFDIVDAKTIVL